MTDEIFNQIEPVLLEIKPKVGSPPRQSDRMFIEAVLYVARTGIPFRDLPDEFGNYSAVYNRLKRWKANRTWEQLWLEPPGGQDFIGERPLYRQYLPPSASAWRWRIDRKRGSIKTGSRPKSRGLKTKIHLDCINEKAAISITLTPDQASDAKTFDAVFVKLPAVFSLFEE